MAISTFYIFVSVSIRERREKRRIKIRERAEIEMERRLDSHLFHQISKGWCGNFSRLFRVVKSAKSQHHKFYGGNSNSGAKKQTRSSIQLHQVSVNNHLPVLFLLPKMCWCLRGLVHNCRRGSVGVNKDPFVFIFPRQLSNHFNNLSPGFWIYQLLYLL